MITSIILKLRAVAVSLTGWQRDRLVADIDERQVLITESVVKQAAALATVAEQRIVELERIAERAHKRRDNIDRSYGDERVAQWANISDAEDQIDALNA